MVVLVDVTPSGLALAAEQRRHVRDVVVPLAVRHGAAVVVAPIDEAAFADPQPADPISFDTRAAGGNPLAAERITGPASSRLVAAIDRLLSSPHATGGSDVVGALRWAGTSLGGGNGPPGRPGPWRGIVVLSDAVSTAPPCDLALTPPRAEVARVVSACLPAGPLQLGGVDVCFLGAGAHPVGVGAAIDPTDLERFWREVVERGHGTVTGFQTSAFGEACNG